LVNDVKEQMTDLKISSDKRVDMLNKEKQIIEGELQDGQRELRAKVQELEGTKTSMMELQQ